jgi:hypothetical protein
VEELGEGGDAWGVVEDWEEGEWGLVVADDELDSQMQLASEEKKEKKKKKGMKERRRSKRRHVGSDSEEERDADAQDGETSEGDNAHADSSDPALRRSSVPTRVAGGSPGANSGEEQAALCREWLEKIARDRAELRGRAEELGLAPPRRRGGTAAAGRRGDDLWSSGSDDGAGGGARGGAGVLAAAARRGRRAVAGLGVLSDASDVVLTGEEDGCVCRAALIVACF